jgi:hypothetical protein
LELSSRLARNEGLPSANVDREVVFLNASMDSYVALDETGRRIWELLETPRRVDDLVAELGRQFDGARGLIEADLLTFLRELEHEGMVRVIDDDTAS